MKEVEIVYEYNNSTNVIILLFSILFLIYLFAIYYRYI